MGGKTGRCNGFCSEPAPGRAPVLCPSTGQPFCTGLTYDDKMLLLGTSGFDQPNRIRAIWDMLHATGLVAKCRVYKPRPITDDVLELVHSKGHIHRVENGVPAAATPWALALGWAIAVGVAWALGGEG